MWRIDVRALRIAAKARGDETGYAISRSTGISESSAYRILAGTAQPDLNTAMRIAETYHVPVEALVERIQIESVAA